MEQKRFLLPFTYDVDVKALHFVLQLAKIYNATLVALALIPLSEQQRPEDVRLEYLEQVQDFLAVLHTQAAIHSVKVEEHELYTHDVLESIHCYTQYLYCERVLLSYEGEKTHFLHAHEAQQLRVKHTLPLHILYTQHGKRERKDILHMLTTQLAASF
ncbi:MAG: hypothetical protein PVS3B3_05850 [Ktedonobacteraceae bacterium]